MLLHADHLIPYHYGLTGPFPFVTYARDAPQTFRSELDSLAKGAAAKVTILDTGESWHHYQ